MNNQTPNHYLRNGKAFQHTHLITNRKVLTSSKMNEITLIAHSPEELPPRYPGNCPSFEHWYFAKVKKYPLGEIGIDVTCYDFEYGKWLFLRGGEELIEWYTVKDQPQSYSKNVCSYVQEEMRKAKDTAQEPQSKIVNEWTLPAYAEEVNKFLEMLGYEPLSPHKVSHAWAAGQSPRIFVEDTLGNMLNGKTSVYEVSQQIEKSLDDERSKQFYFERVAEKVREIGTGPFGVGRGFTDKCMQDGQSVEECAQAWTKRN